MIVEWNRMVRNESKCEGQVVGEEERHILVESLKIRGEEAKGRVGRIHSKIIMEVQ